MKGSDISWDYDILRDNTSSSIFTTTITTVPPTTTPSIRPTIVVTVIQTTATRNKLTTSSTTATSTFLAVGSTLFFQGPQQRLQLYQWQRPLHLIIFSKVSFFQNWKVLSGISELFRNKLIWSNPLAHSKKRTTIVQLPTVVTQEEWLKLNQKENEDQKERKFEVKN